jgi:hypothetical protein
MNTMVGRTKGQMVTTRRVKLDTTHISFSLKTGNRMLDVGRPQFDFSVIGTGSQKLGINLQIEKNKN